MFKHHLCGVGGLGKYKSGRHDSPSNGPGEDKRAYGTCRPDARRDVARGIVKGKRMPLGRSEERDKYWWKLLCTVQ